MHEGPTENRLGELGSLYKFYYYFFYYCLVKNAIVNLTVRLKENTKCISGNSLSLLGAQNRDNGAASQTLLTEVKLRLRRRLPLQRLRNEKVMGAKIRLTMISGILTGDSPFSCWPTCHVSMFLATVPEVKMKKWSSQWTQFIQLRKKAWKKFRTSTGFEPVTSRLPVRCSTNWAMKPLTLGAV